MISLGINVGHDRGAALVKDGVLVGAVAQERIDRIKHSPDTIIPFEAINELLKYLDISFEEIRYIGISSTAVDSKNLINYYTDKIKEYYNCGNFEMVSVPHHLSHALAAYHTSDFNDAVILVADGGGDTLGSMEEAESIFIAKGMEIYTAEQRLQCGYMHPMSRVHNYLYPFMNRELFNEPVSIGKKYEQITQLIGFGSHGEGKTMGLAAYGNSIIEKPVMPVKNLDFDLSFGDMLAEIEENTISEEKSYSQYINENRANIANSIQKYAENQVLEIVKYIKAKYQAKNICLAGGLFLNCPINHRILEEIDDITLHICPATADDGQAIGNAFAAFKKFDFPIKNSSSVLPYLGLSYTDDQIENAINKKGLKFDYLSEEQLTSAVAKEIYNNKNVAVCFGRSEVGPRALCHRSILANPCWEGMKDYLNERVKHRESFRPFAPVVKADYQYKIFDLKQNSPYMLFSAQVKEEYKSVIPSVTHVDGSARIQAVSSDNNRLMYSILDEFEKISGIPVLLNTSFNDNGEPIVETPDDAIKTFLLTNIDVLVLNNYIVYKDRQ